MIVRRSRREAPRRGHPCRTLLWWPSSERPSRGNSTVIEGPCRAGKVASRHCLLFIYPLPPRKSKNCFIASAVCSLAAMLLYHACSLIMRVQLYAGPANKGSRGPM
jgi:hypothetical protein